MKTMTFTPEKTNRIPLIKANLDALILLVNKRWMKGMIIWMMLQTLTGAAALAQQTAEVKPAFTASVDGTPFTFRKDWALSSNLVYQQPSLDGARPQRTIINIMLDGESYAATDGNWFNESIQFEICYTGQMPDSNSICSLALQHNSTVYSFIKGMGGLKITSFAWSSDHRSFTLSADYDFTMRSWGYPNNGKKDVKLTGHLENISVTVPGWLLAKM